MDIKRADMIARDLLTFHLNTHWSLKWTNAKQRFGAWSESKRRVTFSKPLTILNSEEEFINTVLHEIAHALTPLDPGHGFLWKEKALEIGCTGERTFNTTVMRPPKTYRGVCPHCNRTIKRFRRTRIACGVCCRKLNGGKFDTDFLFVWTKIKGE